MQSSVYTNKIWSATAPADPSPFSPEVLQIYLADAVRNGRASRSLLRAPIAIRGFYPFERSIHSRGVGW